MCKQSSKIITVVLVAVVLGLILWGGFVFLNRDYIFWNGTLLPREAESLDISGKRIKSLDVFTQYPDLRELDARGTRLTPEQYQQLQQMLPVCHILWDIPIQGTYYNPDTEAITVSALTDAEMALLHYLPRLSVIDVGQWEDYPRILALKQACPDAAVLYSVVIGQERWDSDVVSLIVEDADPKELREKLPYFSRLESILLTGQVPTAKTLASLQEAFPDIFFLWKMDILGKTLETDMVTMDLSDVELESTRELEELLPYFPVLETVELGDCDLPDEELVALANRFPDVHFLFDLTIGEYTLRTDAREIDISDTPFENTEEVEQLVRCFHNAEKVVMCGCGLSSKDMDALNKRHDKIRFVWSVNLGGMWFRTDAIHFTPNRWGLKLSDENIYDLRYCTDMVCVDIGHATGVTNCEWVRFMPKLKYLILAETSISDITPLTGLEELIFLELFLSDKIQDYSPLVTCKALEDLNLCYTRGAPEAIGEMTWLKRLWWSGCWAGRKYLADKLPDTEKQFFSRSSTGEGWREGQHYYDMRDFIGMHYMVG